ncbi:MAG: hypothetical protein H7237_01945 [Alkalinema sp. FL-bin-369]|jgi:hypothetical protein|nr:hypothetical protein [Leptolyngbyaceae cyanobacterium LF-bin-369]
MAGTKRRSPTSTLVSKSAISQASSTLLDLPEKPKEIWSLREAINALKDQITSALDRGYGYPEISKMLTAQGVEISASTLKYYLSSVRREDGTKTKRRKTSGKLTEKTLSQATAAVEGAVSDDDDKKTRGRKPKADEVEEIPVAAKRGRVPAASKVEKTATKTPGTRGRRKASA